jgi:hypothetical protein
LETLYRKKVRGRGGNAEKMIFRNYFSKWVFKRFEREKRMHGKHN